ncbi:MAG: hypothetical protein ACXWQR_10040, partial [Ktedonobacterales bacterium]
LLFGALPFIWGWKARQGWKPGLAYGLGVVVGFPWLIPGAIMRVSTREASGVVVMLLAVLAFWLLVPFAMLASWLGSRARSWLRHIPLLRRISPSLHSRANTHRRLAPTRVLVMAVTLALIVVSLWSGIQATAWGNRPQPTVMQQLAAAERIAGFHAHLPATLPPGMQLVHVSHDRPGCTPCSIGLTYRDPQGRALNIDESNRADPWLADYTPPNYMASEGTGGSIHPVWWLGDDVRSYRQRMVAWSANDTSYMLVTFDDFSLYQLEQIAATISPS